MPGLIARLGEHTAYSSLAIMAMRGGMLVAKFILALFIARFMGLEQLGRYGLIAGAAAVWPVVMRLGVFASVSREAVGQPLPALTRNLRHYASGTLLLYLLPAPIALTTGWYFGTFWLAALALLIIVLEHAAYDSFVITNNLKQPLLANAILSLQSAVWIYLFVVLAFALPAMRQLEVLLAFWIAGSALSLILALWLTRRWPWREALAQPLSRDWYRPYLHRSWRLYLSEVLTVTINYLDRYLITFFFGLELVGVYVLFWQVANAICNLVGAGVVRLYSPLLIAAHQRGRPDEFSQLYRTCTYRTVGSAAALALACALAVPFLIAYTNQPMAIDYLPLLWLMLATLIVRMGSDLASSGLYARHNDIAMLQTAALRLLLAISVGVASLQLFGIYGVVVTTVAVYGASIACTARLWNRSS